MSKTHFDGTKVQKGMKSGKGNHISLRDSEIARQHITKKQQKQISDLYRQSYLRVKKQIRKIPNKSSTSGKIQKVYLENLAKQLKDSYQDMGNQLEKTIKNNAKDTAASVVADMNKFAKGFGLPIKGAYSHVPQKTVDMLATGQVYNKDWSLSKSIWGDVSHKMKDIDEILARGTAENKSSYDIAKDLEKYVDPSARKDWKWSKVYPGTAKKVDYHAQRLARTMVSHAYQQSMNETVRYNPFVTGILWRSAGTKRTCELCKSRDGTIYPKDQVPLDHPNGMCTFLPQIPHMNDVADRLGNWANGKSDPALDSWYSHMFDGKKPPPVSKVKKVSKSKPKSKVRDVFTADDAKEFNIPGANSKLLDSVAKSVNMAPKEMKSLMTNQLKKLHINLTKGDMYYSPQSNSFTLASKLFTGKDANFGRAGLVHETIHSLDWSSTKVSTLSHWRSSNHITRDMISTLSNTLKNPKAGKTIAKELKSVGDSNAVHYTADLFDALTAGRRQDIFWGHDVGYYKSSPTGTTKAEAMANYAALKSLEANKALDMVNKYVPGMEKAYQAFIKEVTP